MSFHAPFDDQGEVISEINMTPLVDVMLVLLIIFMLTVPVLTHSIKLDVPSASAVAEQAKPDTVIISVAADGGLFWNEVSVSESELRQRLAGSAARKPQPVLRLRGDRKTEYDHIIQVMAMMQGAGIEKLGFVTEPLR
ncbi:MAG: biopolymer transporter ExbD [bacterium]|nr:biopolymer transporter ExbD [bacterium]